MSKSTRGISPLRSTQRVPILVLLSLVVLAQIGCGDSATMSASETAASDALREMGGILVKDAKGVHPATLMMMSDQIKSDLDTAIGHVGNLPYLTHLEMTDLAVTDAHMKTVSGLGRINSLVLSGTQVSDEGLKTISGLNLDTLYIDNTKISSAAMDMIAGIKSLKILDISRTDTLSNIAAIETLPNLEWLIIDKTKIDTAAIGSIAKMPELKRLSINGSTVAAADIEFLKKEKPSLKIDAASADPATESAEAQAARVGGAE